MNKERDVEWRRHYELWKAREELQSQYYARQGIPHNRFKDVIHRLKKEGKNKGVYAA